LAQLNGRATAIVNIVALYGMEIAKALRGE
jgi:hypothetical protein